MTHLVKYTKSDGQTGEHETEELNDAIAHVERLRNDEGVDSARIFCIEEISFEFKPYYRVELGGSVVGTTAGDHDSGAHAAPADPPPPPRPSADAPAPESARADSDPAATAAADSAPAETATVPADSESAPLLDPWADAPPPPSRNDAETDAEAEPVTTGRRGLFGR